MTKPDGSWFRHWSIGHSDLIRHSSFGFRHSPGGFMRVSAKAEYACIAMLELASSYGETQPVRVKTIADQHGIPQRFLVQILLQLKGAGYVTSIRGASGGYQLVRPPEE